MTVRELLARLQTLDVRVTLSGDRLRLSAPPGVLTPGLMQEIESTKPEILAFLKLADTSARDATAIPMRAEGTKPPVFVIPGHNGDIFCYLPMLRHLSPDQPVFALQPPGLEDGEEPETSIADLARRFADVIARSVPTGSVRLAGYCMGGVTAFEVAALLRQRGIDVPVVALFGTSCPTVYWRRYAFSTAYQDLRERWRLVVVGRSRWQVVRHVLRRLVTPSPPQVTSTPRTNASDRSRRLQEATIAAVKGHLPTRLDGRATLYLPCPGPSGAMGRRLDWRRFATQGAEVVLGPDECTGDTMLLEPCIGFFGPRFQAELDRASDGALVERV